MMGRGARGAVAFACAAALVAAPFAAGTEALAKENAAEHASGGSSSAQTRTTYPQSVAVAKVALNEPSGVPLGGQSNKYNQENGQAWCAYFVMWCARAAGADVSVVPDMPACRDMMAFYQRQGRFGSLACTPKAGDLVFFAYTPGGVANHVGIVLKATDTTLTVREGNTDGGRVATHTYSRMSSNGCVSPSLYILGYARPDYARAVRMVTGDGSALGGTSDASSNALGNALAGSAGSLGDARVSYEQVSEAYHEVLCQTEVDGSYSIVATQLHDYVWQNDQLICKECGALFANHTKGEYLVPDDLQAEDGVAQLAQSDDSDAEGLDSVRPDSSDTSDSSEALTDSVDAETSAQSAEAGGLTIPAGTMLRVTKVRVNDEGQYLGRVSYQGEHLWVALHDVQRNGTAGTHEFHDGACSDCGIHQASTEPGTYQVASKATLFANDGSGASTELSEGQELTIIRVFIGPDASYWGKTDDDRMVLMSQLAVAPLTTTSEETYDVRD